MVTGVDGESSVAVPLTDSVAAHRARMSGAVLGPTECSNAAGVLADDVTLEEPNSGRITDGDVEPAPERLQDMWMAAAAQRQAGLVHPTAPAGDGDGGLHSRADSNPMTLSPFPRPPEAELTRAASNSIGDAAAAADGGSTGPTPTLRPASDPYATSTGSTDATPVMQSVNAGPPPTPPFAAAMPSVAITGAAPPSPQLRDAGDGSAGAGSGAATSSSAATAAAPERVTIALPRPSRVDLDDIEGPARSDASNAATVLHPHGAAVDLDQDADM